MSRKFNFVVTLFFAFAVVTACIQPVEVSPPSEKTVIVHCILDPHQVKQELHLLYSCGIHGTQFEPVEEAEISVHQENGTHLYYFEYVGDGRWESTSFMPTAGATYHLSIKIPGRDEMHARTTMPEKCILRTAFYPPENWNEDLLEEKYYLIMNREKFSQFQRQTWFYHFNYKAYNLMREEGGSSMSEKMPGILFSLDSTGRQYLYILGRKLDAAGKMQPVALATNNSLVDDTNLNGRCFKAAPSSDTSVIHQRYIQGISRQFEGLPLHDDYLRIDYPGYYDNGLRNIYNISYLSDWGTVDLPLYKFVEHAESYFSVVGDFEYDYFQNNAGQSRTSLYFCFVSQEYDRYLQDLQRFLDRDKGDLLTSLYRNAYDISTNIEGGLGIFGGIYVLEHDCDVLKFKIAEDDYTFASYPFLSSLPLS